MKCHMDHRGALVHRQGLATRRPPLNALGQETTAPSTDCALRRRNRASLQPVGGQQHDPWPPNHLLFGVAVSDQPLQLMTIRCINRNRVDLAHWRRLARPRHLVNLPSDTEH